MKKKLSIKHLEVKTVDLSDPKKISQASTEIVKKRDIVKLHILDKEVFQIKKERARKKKEKFKILATEMFRSNVKALAGIAIFNAFIAEDYKIKFLVVSAIIHSLSQVGFLALDLTELKKDTRAAENNKNQIRFTATRILKNTVTAIFSLILVFQLGSGSLAKWILPIQILEVLYFVIVIYFMINTGSLVKYCKTLLFNILLFIELFFFQRDSQLPEENQNLFLQKIWIYYVLLIGFVIILLIFLYLALKAFKKERATNAHKMYLLLAMDGFAACGIMTLAIVHINTEVYSNDVIGGVASLSLVCAGLFFASYFTMPFKNKWIEQDYKAIMLDIEQEEINVEKGEEKIETTSVPFYLVRLTKDYYKAADKYDLLKLATHRTQASTASASAELLNKEEREKEEQAKAELALKLEKEEAPPLQQREMAKEACELSRKDDEISMIVKLKPNKAYIFSGMKNKFTDRSSRINNTKRNNEEANTNRSQKSQRNHEKAEQGQEDTYTVKSSVGGIGGTLKRKGTNLDTTSANLCFICFDSEQNCVVMPCGHGGICVDCGTEAWNSSEHCYLCKRSVESLLEIDPVPVAGMCRVKNTIMMNDEER